MMAWMNREALALTVAEQRAIYWSRSRGKLWRKGEESGHVQKLHELRLDCDADVIILLVEQLGGIACHTGRESCFYRVWENGAWQTVDPVLKDPQAIYQGQTTRVDTLSRLAEVLEARKGAAPDSSYVASLYHKGLNKILEKVGEESVGNHPGGQGRSHQRRLQRPDLRNRGPLVPQPGHPRRPRPAPAGRAGRAGPPFRTSGTTRKRRAPLPEFIFEDCLHGHFRTGNTGWSSSSWWCWCSAPSA